MVMQRGLSFISFMVVGEEDDWGGEICSHTFLSIISFMSSRCIPILNMSPSTSLHTFYHIHTHTHTHEWMDALT